MRSASLSPNSSSFFKLSCKPQVSSSSHHSTSRLYFQFAFYVTSQCNRFVQLNSSILPKYQDRSFHLRLLMSTSMSPVVRSVPSKGSKTGFSGAQSEGVWYDNVPHTCLVEDKGGQNWISRDKDKFIFPGGGT
ncbi:hypothetical protein L2E82_45201 [Cichorium intybus]|uniref:Uncharacterized protein n=1 Tax=Cichorium intybus TaxID=13427 RepID=A0ACB8ZRD0_CICIN|nr:hypothetical protein L2E82_45201 [Cichorium intybus]